MAKSVIKSIKPICLYYADVVSLATKGRFSFDAQDWDDALPGRKAAKAIKVETDFTYQIHNQPDYEAEMGYRFLGDFRKSGGVWSGEVEKVQFLRDGKIMGVVKINSEVDISRIVDVASAGMIWNELTSTGLKGGLSKKRDDINGSVSDDVINLGGGHDQINASLGDDLVRGGGGHDLIDGYNGNDVLKGGAGDDYLIGNGGDDRLFGQGGDDVFQGDSQGSNIWRGGKGADDFQVSSLNWDQSAPTRVRDFNLRQGDQVDLSDFNILTFYEVDEIRYIGKRNFSGEDRVLEIQMRKGMVAMDYNGDKVADYGLKLDGMGTFKGSDLSWIDLPEGWDFA